jgi:predicted alpha/beta-hydrolase family hydrolase
MASRAIGVLLAPGAGADRNQAALVALDDALTASGAVVERMDFPYRRAGRRAPDREPVLLDAVRTEAAALAARRMSLVLGGRSMGGRICSMAVADGLPALGLALVSYPLHPPGRPDRLRTAHFPRLDVPCLFVSGTRDAFGRPEELEAATAAIPGPVTHVWLEGRDHGLRGADASVVDAVTAWFTTIRPGSRRARRPAG